MITILILLINTLGIALLVFLILQNRKSDNSGEISKSIEALFEKNDRALKDEMSLNRKEIADSEKRLREELVGLFKGFGDSLDKRMSELGSVQNKNFEGFSVKLTELIEKNDKNIDKVRDVVEKKLEAIQKDNTEKLEAMRVTVEEKLQSTLEKRLGESFKIVSDRLEKVHKSLGEIQSLSDGVDDLKKVLSNVKTRGVMGELQLRNLLEQILTNEQYASNVKMKKDDNTAVEYAVKLPGRDKGDLPVWLPLDSKFPIEKYHELLNALDTSDVKLIELKKQELGKTIKICAKDIKEKYINPPNTTDFAVMFLPFEGLYSEVLRINGLFEFIQREFKVIVTGPTTLAALLNSLQMGFKTLAIQKRSSEVWEILGAIKTEFSNFGAILEKTKKKLQEASNIVDQAGVRSRVIERKLRDVHELPSNKAQELIGAETEKEFSQNQQDETTYDDEIPI